MFLDRPHFVLERRIEQPLPAVEAVLGTRIPIARGTDVALGERAELWIDSPAYPGPGVAGTSWRVDARLVTGQGSLVARVEIEIDAWSTNATRLQLRPLARHPERWGRRRLRRYFTLAHVAADRVSRQLGDRAKHPQRRAPLELVGAVS